MFFGMSLCTDCLVHVLVGQGVNLTNNFGITIKLWFFILLLFKFWRNDQCIFVNVTTILFSCHVPKIPSEIVIRKKFKMKWIFHRFSIVKNASVKLFKEAILKYGRRSKLHYAVDEYKAEHHKLLHFKICFIQARCCYLCYTRTKHLLLYE